MTKTSINTISFNKLKSRILEKNESYHIKYLRILSFFFLLISILLIYFVYQIQLILNLPKFQFL